MPDQTQITLWFIPFVVVLILIEIGYSVAKKRNWYNPYETITSLTIMATTMALNVGVRGFYLVAYSFSFEYRIFDIHNPWLYWILLFFIQDLSYYLLHCLEHFSRIFWAVHVTHHNSTDYNLTIGCRSSVFQPFYRFLFFSPMALMGFRPLDIIFMYTVTQLWGLLVHTPVTKRFPKIIELFFITPSMHRVHHGSNEIYLDKNMGMVLVIWDRLFGTFQPELESDPVVYGLTKNPKNRYLPNMVFHSFGELWQELKEIKGPLTKLRYLFMPPGWAPEKSSKL